MTSLDDINYLLNKSYFFLKFRPRTEKEIRQYLYKKIANKHWSTEDAEKVINILKEQGLIDDKKFLELYVNDRLNLKPKSKKLIIKELKQKGVSDNLIEKYFSQNEINEEEVAFKLLKKRWSRYKNLPEKKRLEKVLRFLLSKGFSFEIAKKIYQKIITINL